MLDYGTVRLLHRHAAGEWVEMNPREHHDAAEHDPEREWLRGRVYECDCGDRFTVLPDDQSELERPAGRP